ncbi:hypothetical protein ES703_67546 [subsurface metagenome]
MPVFTVINLHRAGLVKVLPASTSIFAGRVADEFTAIKYDFAPVFVIFTAAVFAAAVLLFCRVVAYRAVGKFDFALRLVVITTPEA